MTTYQNRNEIQEKLKEMLPEQVAECKRCDELPAALEQLIKHNFQAEFVCYQKKSNTVEVGVQVNEDEMSYPQIKTYSFKLEETISWLGKTYRNDERDLNFYGKLIAGNAAENEVDEVVLV